MKKTPLKLRSQLAGGWEQLPFQAQIEFLQWFRWAFL